jgi:hypothetical protein
MFPSRGDSSVGWHPHQMKENWLNIGQDDRAR